MDSACQREVLFSPKRVILVGLGGIGSKLADELARYITYENKAPKELVVIDGDVYSQSNHERQSILESDVGRPKAQVWADGLAAEFRKLVVKAISGYVVPDSVKKDNTVHISKMEMEDAVTILAVDNHKTRKMFSDHFQKEVKNGVLINGGNKTEGEGSIITAVRVGGKQLLPAIDAFHPEIADPKDKNPGELSCAELAKVDGGTQIIWANQMVAALIGNEFHCIMKGVWDALLMRGEVYFDILANVAVARQRRVSEEEVEQSKPDVISVPTAQLKVEASHVDIKIVDERENAKAPKKRVVKKASK